MQIENENEFAMNFVKCLVCCFAWFVARPVVGLECSPTPGIPPIPMRLDCTYGHPIGLGELLLVPKNCLEKRGARYIVSSSVDVYRTATGALLRTISITPRTATYDQIHGCRHDDFLEDTDELFVGAPVILVRADAVLTVDVKTGATKQIFKPKFTIDGAERHENFLMVLDAEPQRKYKRATQHRVSVLDLTTGTQIGGVTYTTKDTSIASFRLSAGKGLEVVIEGGPPGSVGTENWTYKVAPVLDAAGRNATRDGKLEFTIRPKLVRISPVRDASDGFEVRLTEAQSKRYRVYNAHQDGIARDGNHMWTTLHQDCVGKPALRCEDGCGLRDIVHMTCR